MKLGIGLAKDLLGAEEGFIGPMPCVGNECIIPPVCATADTLCRLNEFAKENGIDIPSFVEDKTGFELPTNLPQSAQDGLTWINDSTNGWISPVTASVGISLFASLAAMYTTYKLYQAVAKDCPTDILAVIKDDAKRMEFYLALTEEVKVALSQLDKKTAEIFFANACKNQTVAQALLQLGADKQIDTVRAVMKNNKMTFSDKKQAKRLDAKKAQDLKAKTASVKLPGSQADASSTAPVQPTATNSSYFSWVPSPIAYVNSFNAWRAKKPATATTVVNPTTTVDAKVDTKKTI